jgi:hypothetical protein
VVGNLTNEGLKGKYYEIYTYCDPEITPPPFYGYHHLGLYVALNGRMSGE